MYRGWGRPVSQNFAPSSPWYLAIKDLPRDLARSKQLLAEAGMPDGFKTTMTVGDTNYFRDVAQVFQSQMRRIGIDITIQVYDIPSWVKRLTSGDFDVFDDSYFPKIDPDDAYYRYFHTNGGVWLDGGFWSNPELDQLLDAGRVETNVQKRREIYTKVVQLIQADAATIFYASGDSVVGWRSNVHEFAPQLIGALSYPGGGLQDAWLAK
jgi:peptide/nickel transport system substrate-binding protein